MLTGIVAPEVLEWLLEDPGLKQTLEATKFTSDGDADCECKKGLRYEFGRKVSFSGRLRSSATSSLNGVLLQQDFLGRTRAWDEAFLTKNESQFAELVGDAVGKVRRLSREDWVENESKCNACHFIRTPWNRWLNTCGELHITDAGDVEHGFWAEPAHNDGAASILHLGLCLAGRKHVKFQQPGEEEDVIVDIEPGSVYFGGVTGARHQVVHCKALQHELVDAPLAERSCSVAIMMRTALFPHSRSRISDNQPHPKSAFRCMATAFREGLARLRLELPSLEECVTAEAGLTAEAPKGKATEAGLAAEASTGDATEA